MANVLIETHPGSICVKTGLVSRHIKEFSEASRALHQMPSLLPQRELGTANTGSQTSSLQNCEVCPPNLESNGKIIQFSDTKLLPTSAITTCIVFQY